LKFEWLTCQLEKREDHTEVLLQLNSISRELKVPKPEAAGSDEDTTIEVILGVCNCDKPVKSHQSDSELN
jgi:hypothetical protein